MDSTASRPSDDLQTVLQHAVGLLQQDPGMVEQQARDILKVYPNIETAGGILGSAYRRQGQPDYD